MEAANAVGGGGGGDHDGGRLEDEPPEWVAADDEIDRALPHDDEQKPHREEEEVARKQATRGGGASGEDELLVERSSVIEQVVADHPEHPEATRLASIGGLHDSEEEDAGRGEKVAPSGGTAGEAVEFDKERVEADGTRRGWQVVPSGGPTGEVVKTERVEEELGSANICNSRGDAPVDEAKHAGGLGAVETVGASSVAFQGDDKETSRANLSDPDDLLEPEVTSSGADDAKKQQLSGVAPVVQDTAEHTPLKAGAAASNPQDSDDSDDPIAAAFAMLKQLNTRERVVSQKEREVAAKLELCQKEREAAAKMRRAEEEALKQFRAEKLQRMEEELELSMEEKVQQLEEEMKLRKLKEMQQLELEMAAKMQKKMERKESYEMNRLRRAVKQKELDEMQRLKMEIKRMQEDKENEALQRLNQKLNDRKLEAAREFNTQKEQFSCWYRMEEEKLNRKESELKLKEQELRQEEASSRKIHSAYCATKLGRMVGMDKLRKLIGQDKDYDLLLPLVAPPPEEESFWNRRNVLYNVILTLFLPFIFGLQALFAKMDPTPSKVVQSLVFYFCGYAWATAGLGGLLGLFSRQPAYQRFSTHLGRFVFLAFCILQVAALWYVVPTSLGSTIAAGILCGAVIAFHLFCWAEDFWGPREQD